MNRLPQYSLQGSHKENPINQEEIKNAFNKLKKKNASTDNILAEFIKDVETASRNNLFIQQDIAT